MALSVTLYLSIKINSLRWELIPLGGGIVYWYKMSHLGSSLVQFNEPIKKRSWDGNYFKFESLLWELSLLYLLQALTYIISFASYAG